ncbi:MAG: hypothetical protein QME68_03100, partial [Elusimicrobiota bacterium]|nr:hypothetical protein [Elusimicrobiota bacterium]
REIHIEIFPSSGSYEGCPEEIFYSINVFLNRRKPTGVFVNGEKIGIKYTNKIFSQTVESQFEFLRIEVGNCKRNHKTTCLVQLK